jgi:hypothetical protein
MTFRLAIAAYLLGTALLGWSGERGRANDLEAVETPLNWQVAPGDWRGSMASTTLPATPAGTEGGAGSSVPDLSPGQQGIGPNPTAPPSSTTANRQERD